MIYEGLCNQCGWHMILLREDIVQEWAENHMMITGHVVEISEHF